MSFTFRGTYTQNNGDAPAAGTVAIKNRSSGATLDTATLDASGSYELVLDEQEGEMRVVETMTGVPVRTYEVGVSQGSVTDTSRDIGYIGPAQSGASVADSRMQLSATTAPTLPANGDNVEVSSLGVDGEAGDDLTLGVDNKTVTFVTAGTYYVCAEAQTSTGHTVTKVKVGTLFTPQASAGTYGSSLDTSMNPAADGDAISASGMYRVAAGTTLVFIVSALASTDSTLSWFGVDIIRVV